MAGPRGRAGRGDGRHLRQDRADERGAVLGNRTCTRPQLSDDCSGRVPSFGQGRTRGAGRHARDIHRAGHTFDAYAAVIKVLGTATTDLLMIDPYADAKILTRYAVSAPEQVSVRILADEAPLLPALASARSGTMGAAVRPNSPSVCAAGSSQDTS